MSNPSPTMHPHEIGAVAPAEIKEHVLWPLPCKVEVFGHHEPGYLWHCFAHERLADGRLIRLAGETFCNPKWTHDIRDHQGTAYFHLPSGERNLCQKCYAILLRFAPDAKEEWVPRYILWSHMFGPTDKLAALLRESGIPPKIGLRQQGRFETVERMLSEGKNWKAIGNAIGWHARAVEEWYALEKDLK